MKNRKKAFTLAELLVVIAIIAVLVAIAIPVFSGATKKAEIATVKANLRSAYAEATVQYLLNDAVPTTAGLTDEKGVSYTAAIDDKGVITVTATDAKSKYTHITETSPTFNGTAFVGVDTAAPKSN